MPKQEPRYSFGTIIRTTRHLPPVPTGTLCNVIEIKGSDRYRIQELCGQKRMVWAYEEDLESPLLEGA